MNDLLDLKVGEMNPKLANMQTMELNASKNPSQLPHPSWEPPFRVKRSCESRMIPCRSKLAKVM